MNPIKAFVGHSYLPEDKEIVGTFLDILTEIGKLHPYFSWQHAQRAESAGIDEKVLSQFSEINVFIGICTKRERIIPSGINRFAALWNLGAAAPIWKTSDWIIQEIGLAIGRRCKLILLVEVGVRSPGGLQGDLEYIPFKRSSPERVFTKLAQMITAIAPVNTASAGIGVQSTYQAEAEKPSSQPEFDWKTPTHTWQKREYQFAFRMAIMMGEHAVAKTVDESYLSKVDAKDASNRLEWLAFCEYVRITWGKDGSIQTLKDLSVANPSCGIIFEYLAQAFERFKQYDDAARYFGLAADKITDPKSRAVLLGRVVLAYANAKAETSVVDRAVSELKAYVAEHDLSEYEIIIVLKELAELRGQHQVAISYLQRMVEDDPSDIDARFSLAYKHAELGNNELALYHYSAIPFAKRNPTTWNNLGVAFDKAKLVAKAVNAYQKAGGEHDTLAMSNLAFKYLSSGFLNEARTIIDSALKCEDIHANIPRALANLEELEAGETKLMEEILDKCVTENKFYSEFGAATLRVTSGQLSGLWKNRDCELEVVATSDSFTASGKYEKSQNPLGLGSLFATPKTETWVVEYQGEVHGCTVEAEVYAHLAGETVSFMGRFSKTTKVLMILSNDETEFKVMEILKDQERRFDKITRLPRR